ncbi:Endolytic murein transglycosylase [Halomicronema hongdechloris C2206]|uniref:Endolytic murein transglycosylase n=1 Tax=Halomicronema hongdechloris C2206 TaxID=1641165 RepID=A0A1V8NLC5_9CYAN|nr:endolytic transglycosylase MltG [Halomicronema hongdechloris]ASC69655.1 Endolytic murein transglycosylase [Halomicronema hongdechloris C2206]
MRSQTLSRAIFYSLLLPAAVAVAGWQGWAWWSWASAPVEADADTAIQIHIPRGTSGQQIGEDLEAAGLIRSALAWDLWARWQRLRQPQGAFQAGTYALTPSQPLGAIATQIWQGEVLQQTFTIPEGWSRQQMAEFFEAEGFFPAAAFLAATQQLPRHRYPWLPDDLPHLEGLLYPDTYQLPIAGVTPEAIVQQMLDRFEAVALPRYQEATTELNLLEWVTLASIVEKEAVVADERQLIAGVFMQRLQQDMPLGADPTVEYALNIQQTPDQPLTLAQVRTPSPYNTYLNPGLPPTPIASPGLASLEATLNPADTDYLYFVARYDGTHIFSRTLEEHEAAQAKIRAQQADQGSEAAENGAEN